jgi:hypothetical protein
MTVENASPAAALPSRNLLIPSERVADFHTFMARAARRAAKLNLSAPTATFLNKEVKEIGKNAFREYSNFTITIPCPEFKVDGWEFIAALEHGNKEGNVIRTAGEQVVPVEYRTVHGKCEHCNMERRRNNTYVFRNEQGSYKQVGSTCISDFFGANVEELAAQFEFVSELEENARDFEDSNGGGSDLIRVDTYLACVAEIVLTLGWVSKAKAYEEGGESTASKATSLYMNKTDVSEEAKKLGTDAREWASALDKDSTSDYIHNIRLLANEQAVSFKSLGMLASVVSSFRRDEDKKREAARVGTSEFMGTVGDRSVFQLTVNRVMSFEGQYGVTHIHLLTDANANAYVWKSSGTYLDEGKFVILKGTIKAHEVYEKTGVKQTILTRCTELSELPVEKPAKKPRAKKVAAA